MTPAARVSAAVDCLEAILTGEPAEKVLTNWARRRRFAGSGDRRAVRDLVFDAIRHQRSYAWLGGVADARSIMIGALRAAKTNPVEIFSGEGYAAPPLSEAELNAGASLADAPDPVRLDVPDWLWPDLTESLSGAVEETLAALKERAPVFVRVNTLKSDMASAIAALESEGIECRTHHLSPTALEITAKSQRIADSEAYRDGWIELQDVASQAIVDHISPNLKGASVLDYCAGGGGKSLAMAAYGPDRIVAHDIDAKRMADLPDRAARAGCTIDIVASPAGTFDVVFCDCPCSGSGAWRRQPEAKWTLTSTRLSELNAIQDQILTDGAAHVGPGGILVYATCSMLRCENDARIDVFIRRNPDWRVQSARTLSPLEGGDGFFVAVLERAI